MIGDFNTDPNYSRARCGNRFASMESHGWIHAAPTEGASYWTLRGKGVRIDHAFVTRHFSVKRARYLEEVDGQRIVRSKEALSDHALLLVDLLRK
jgi:endonuclease/exonuclease/phosphatase family metal-dependent hydrolase